ncbi:ribose-5-phosphate isomerase RpiA [Methylocystis sp. MJC1]|jgi:ribose 5-phosphate isomerase A|uniref:ribose-5-phosphate isomerase RpiA n=1 Tax=Methylocystis sp. MJC1 TaxID=2654282 RepID=UPI0013EA6195|nr:ribose-5-phosphate isomerase RpiA [Methylocystis sp. MJC1]KAF2989007.1 Ribose-5-phosphate isomerase A [Methylocystis sp. MJC1]MBU6528281.1 ribose-5-phosphate isomerase RpiA [Methylocystis sp. MJC1]UZX11188.1 ribose-5-phosphate isomerase RpiA [Methylocystis sp. MJC1]
MSPFSADAMKRAAAEAALQSVTHGMRLGLGTGSTAAHFVDLLGARVREGLEVVGVPTSERTRLQAEGLGITLSTLDETPELDLTIDGADEFDAALRLIKGGGGALLREKIVAAASKRMFVVADATKEVETLGAFPLPVEIDRFGALSTRLHIERVARGLGLEGPITMRMSAPETPYLTDGGHYIYDCAFGAIDAPETLAERLQAIPGVVDHGLFIGLATAIFVAGKDGVRIVGDVTGGAL